MENTGVCIPKDYSLNYIYLDKLTAITSVKEFLKKYMGVEFKHKYLTTCVLFTTDNAIYNIEISNGEYLVINFKNYGFDIQVYNKIEFNKTFVVLK